jgi:1,4-alpha-glucan branching enzyme
MVQLAGDFSNWTPLTMKRQKDGLYVADVTAAQGTYEYKFIVDGKWLADGDNADRKANRFGTENSVASIA